MAASTSLIYREGAPSINLGEQGKIKGASVVHKRTGRAKCYRYTGVPYAQPPVGDKRFRKPVALPADFRYDAHGRVYCNFGNVCPQPNNYSQEQDPNLSSPPPTQMNAYSEDCLSLNIWVPAVPPLSANGYPILFFIHGGWLQIGNAHHDMVKDPSDLLAGHDEGGKEFGAIIVVPAYRLNVFGFLAMECMPANERGNFGFWDQRMALEWVVNNIAAFKGNPDNITIAGLSAGAHSAHSQALYEYMRLRDQPDTRPLFRRLFLQSNAAMVPSKTIDEHTKQVEQLLGALNIKHDPRSNEALEALRQVNAQKLVEVLPLLPLHTFRALRGSQTGSGEFVDADWSKAMLDGSFARWCKQHNVTFLLGEVEEEENLYSLINAPELSDRDALFRQVNNYYTEEATKQLLQAYEPLPGADASQNHVRQTFGMITADSQVYASQRAFVQLLHQGGLGPESVFRYQIAYRARFLDRYEPKWMGVTHGFDDSLWWFARALLLEPYSDTDEAQFEGQQELDLIRRWIFPFHLFVHGLESALLPKLWYGSIGSSKGNTAEAQSALRIVRRFDQNGQIRGVPDVRWSEKQKVIDTILRIMNNTTNRRQSEINEGLSRQLSQQAHT